MGELSQEEGKLGFSYSLEYRSLPGALPLSRELPLRDGEFDDTAARTFFANLLPDRISSTLFLFI